jgi:nucleotide-binding universal stress UspA family protein
MFDRILVPVDGSLMAENCLPHLISMTRTFDSLVCLLYTLQPLTGDSTNLLNWQIRQAEAKAYLKELSSRLKEYELQVETNVLEGGSPDNLVNYPNGQDSDLILLSSHGKGGENGNGLSATAMQLIQQARTSVMVVRSYRSEPGELAIQRYKRIMVPLDGSKRAEYGLSAAASVARSHQAELILLHVIKPPEMPRRIMLSKVDNELMDQVIESNRAEAFDTMGYLKDSLGCSVDYRIVVSDHVADALHQFVEQETIDLVILNAHGLSGDSQWPYGSIATNFLSYGATPLLVVQDFARDRIPLNTAEMYASDLASSQRPVQYY